MKFPIRRLLYALGGTGLSSTILIVLLFPVAGRWDLPWFWAYVAMYACLAFFGFMLLDVGLMKERWRPGRNGHNTALVAVSRVLAALHFVIAALDVGRFRWSGEIAAPVQGGALVVVVLSSAIVLWAMAINPFFSTVVRIQDDRGHRVITDGPYRVVRHPGYALMFLIVLANGVALGSWWATIPMAAVLIPILLWRTIFEDRYLHEYLAGYTEYARRVPHRLIPGIW
jgi:protein-S-isoprenylcysteine O-methyltransferase Ste14